MRPQGNHQGCPYIWAVAAMPCRTDAPHHVTLGHIDQPYWPWRPCHAAPTHPPPVIPTHPPPVIPTHPPPVIPKRPPPVIPKRPPPVIPTRPPPVIPKRSEESKAYLGRQVLDSSPTLGMTFPRTESPRMTKRGFCISLSEQGKHQGCRCIWAVAATPCHSDAPTPCHSETE